MSAFRVVCVTASISLCAAMTMAAVTPQIGPGGPARIPVTSPALDPVPVAAWDPASPQQLVRIEGTLFQQDSGFFYRVVEDVVTVGLAEGVASWEALVAATASDPALQAELLGLSFQRQNGLGIVDLGIPDADPAEWAAKLFSTGLVRFAEVATYGVWTDIPPNDVLYPQQWALNNTGQTGGTAGADVHAEEAWEISSGNPDVIVAVLDSGVWVNHVDLNANIWINEDEIPGNSVDDDDNGYVDDWQGWDFPNNNNNPVSGFYHGTHVSGIISAIGNNTIGVVGLAGGVDGPGARVMALEVGENFPVGSIIDDAVLYAADNDAHGVTLSLSVGQSTAINDALTYAYETADVFINCSAGNNGPSVGYPANRPEVMSIAATTHNDVKSGFSNPGPQNEVAAPGSDILSTQLNNQYGLSSGTSFSSPYAAALAALIRGVAPSMTAPEIRQLMIDTADDVGPPGFDNGTGWGRINAFQALTQIAFADGKLEFDSAIYTCDDTLSISLTDSNIGGAGVLPITVRSDTEPAGETVQLIEDNFGMFSATLNLTGGPATNDGQLQVSNADLVTADYLDADNGMGDLNVLKTASAPVDCAGPIVLGVEVIDIDADSAKVTWNTDESGTSKVTFGESVPPTQLVAYPFFIKNHAVQLNNLESCTTYRFQLGNVDPLGFESFDDNGGLYYSFQTADDGSGCEAGQLQLDRWQYGCDGSVDVQLTDVDLNVSPGELDLTQVLVSSTSEPDGEWFDLTETELDGGVFSTTVTLGSAGTPGDGQLGVADGDVITATYFDADDGAGSTQTAYATAGVDCTAPNIYGVRVTAISSTRAEVAWWTDEPSTSRVEFGPDAGLGSVAEDLEPQVEHRVAVSAFDSCDRVWFRVSSTDAQGETLIADAEGQPFAFNLNQIGGLVFHDNFETDTGWTLDGEWERATPQGLGNGSKDPDAAWSGSTVLGTDLSGTGTFAGEYEPYVEEWAVSDRFDATGQSNLELIVRRKLGVTAADSARINVNALGSTTVWTSAGSVDDQDWVEFRLDISEVADNLPEVQVGFGIDSTFPNHFYGWNVDEVIVKDATQPDFLTCGGCAGAPSFAGLAAVYDADPCGPSGLTLEWDHATAWGTGAGGTYDVYRDTTPDFVPSALNLVASGIAGAGWVDETVPADTQVWYIVRARNNEDCGGEGLTDANLVRLAATETSDPSTPVEVGETVLARSAGGVHVRLDWASVPGADHYVVRRSTQFDFSFAVEVGTTESTTFEDLYAVSDGAAFYGYRVFAVNACGDEGP